MAPVARPFRSAGPSLLPDSVVHVQDGPRRTGVSRLSTTGSRLHALRRCNSRLGNRVTRRITNSQQEAVMEQEEPARGMGWLRDFPDIRDYTLDHDDPPATGANRGGHKSVKRLLWRAAGGVLQVHRRGVRQGA